MYPILSKYAACIKYMYCGILCCQSNGDVVPVAIRSSHSAWLQHLYCLSFNLSFFMLQSWFSDERMLCNTCPTPINLRAIIPLFVMGHYQKYFVCIDWNHVFVTARPSITEILHMLHEFRAIFPCKIQENCNFVQILYRFDDYHSLAVV